MRKTNYLRIRRFLEITKVLLTILLILVTIVLKIKLLY